MSKRHVAIVGVGQTAFRTHHADVVDLAQDAALGALHHAGLAPEDVDAVFFSMAPTQFMGVNEADKWAVDSVFVTGNWMCVDLAIELYERCVSAPERCRHTSPASPIVALVSRPVST